MKKNKTPLPEPSFTFLKDEPYENKKAEDFYHENFAKALEEILGNDSCLQTIGFFGDWGSGKTTIVKILKDLSEENSDNFEILEYDCWKFEQDSLRRHFLLDIAKQLKVKKTKLKELENNLYFSKPQKLGYQWAFNFRLFGVLIFFSLLGFVAVTGLSDIWQKIVEEQWLILLGDFSKILATSGAATALIPILKSSITVSPIVGNKSKLDSPEEFEKEFKKVIELSPLLKKKDVVIVIDNLDRVSPEKNKEILSTLKTFLETDDKKLQQKVIFLVPCDYKRIRDSWDTDENEPELADEFLRKIFNISIWTPEFILTDLEDHTKKLLKDTGERMRGVLFSEEDSEKNITDDVEIVISAAFKDNPRQIKQFINNLVATLIFAEKTKVSSIIRDNPSFLAKVLILKQLFPDAYEHLKKDWDNPESLQALDLKKDNELKEKYKAFISNTSRITAEDAKPFIYFKEPASSGIAEAKKLKLALIDGDDVEVEKIISGYSKQDQKKSVGFVYQLVLDYQNRPNSLFKIIKSHLLAFARLNIKPSFSQYFESVGKKIDSGLGEEFINLPVKEIFSTIINNSRTQPRLKKSLVTKYSGLFQPSNKEVDDEILGKTLDVLIANIKDLREEDIKNIKEGMEQKHGKDFKFIYSFKELPVDSQKLFLPASIVTTLVSQNLTIPHLIKESFIFNFKELIKAYKLDENVFLGLKTLQDKHVSTGPNPFEATTILKIQEIIKAYLPQESPEEGSALKKAIIAFGTSFNNWFSGVIKDENSNIAVAILWQMRHIIEPTVVTKQPIDDYIVKTPEKKLIELLEYLKEDKKSFFQIYKAAFEQVINSDLLKYTELLSFLYLLDPGFGNAFFQNLIWRQSDMGITVLEKFFEEDRFNPKSIILEKILQTLMQKDINYEITKRAHKIIFENPEPAIKDLLIQYVQQIISSQITQKEQLAYEFYTGLYPDSEETGIENVLDEDDKEKIAQVVIKTWKGFGQLINNDHWNIILLIKNLFEFYPEDEKTQFINSLLATIDHPIGEGLSKKIIDIITECNFMVFELHQSEMVSLRDRLIRHNDAYAKNVLEYFFEKLKPSLSRIKKDKREFWKSIENFLNTEE